jgi:DNA-binding PadR family transcriptional regulator
MKTLSNKEAALLGLLSEKTKHAYEIENDIKERDMRYWTEISMSSVYKLLNKLEKRKLLTSKTKMSSKNIAQKVYAITDEGKRIFKEKLLELASAWQPSIQPVDISLANLNVLSKLEAIKALNKYSESLDKMLKCYSDLQKYLIDNKCYLANIQLATRRLYLLQGEKEWIKKFIQDFKKNEPR